ncbi:MAG: DUF177 domain-containing protein [Rhodospirillales bacterium]|nr:DUF177 domain-containing protein [Rhodospirillales bacterium]
MTEELGWDHPIQDIPETGLHVERVASPEEREAIARTLDLIACSSLTARYALHPRGEGHFRLTGTLQAQIEQSCVVTLEPLTNEIAESFSVDYWPETEIPAQEGGVVDVHDEPDLEPIVTGRIKVGRVVFECLAGAIDLFPRKPGVTFEAPEAPSEDSGRSKSGGPFAALARIKNKG